ncbi:LCP family protein [Kitasatospora sp. HPMI-4]|uniref:LCP family protein n=1 Tax=Kitasatospora sp. HPMI-4 TaxID=3448443 RepID=UPI003F1AFDB4
MPGWLAVGRTLACCVSLAVLGTTGAAWYEYHDLSDGITTSNALEQARRSAPKKLDNSVNLLLIGLDSRRNMDGTDLPPEFIQDELHAGHSSDVGGYNTNSLILLHIPAGGGKVEAVSVPRDDYVMTYDGDGSEQGMHKIKEAYGLAKNKVTPALKAKGLTGAALEQAGREAGRAATVYTLQKFLDVPVDHFAEVNLIGFYDIARAVEPITVCLNKDTSDPAEDGQGSGADFRKGMNTLNASQALSFVRQRHNLDGGDFDRTHRQQAFITAVEYKLKQDGLFGDLGKMRKLFDVVKKDVVIDDRWDILDFAQQAPNLTGGNVEFNTLPVKALKPPVYIPGEGLQLVNYVNPDQIKRTVKVLFGYADSAPAAAAAATADGGAGSTEGTAGSTPAPAAPSAGVSGTVDVYNASSVQGAAADESRALAGMGFTAGRTGTARSHPRSTTVVYGRGAKDGAGQVAARYGTSAAGSSAVPAGHIVVTLGTGYQAPASSDGDSSTGTGSGPGQAGASASGGTPDPAATMSMQGAAVKGDNGIPCVD